MSRYLLIREVVENPGFPFTSSLIHAGRAPRDSKYCDTCFDSSRDEPSDFYLHGFSDLRKMASPSFGFLEPGPPLIGSRKMIERLGAMFSGVVSVRVGYRDWNQSGELSEATAFSRLPRLGLLFVVNRWQGVCRADGSPFPNCSRCGGPDLPPDSDLSSHLGIRGTPTSDFTILAGGGQDRTTVLSDRALAELSRLGYGNLVVAELPHFA